MKIFIAVKISKFFQLHYANLILVSIINLSRSLTIDNQNLFRNLNRAILESSIITTRGSDNKKTG